MAEDTLTLPWHLSIIIPTPLIPNTAIYLTASAMKPPVLQLNSYAQWKAIASLCEGEVRVSNKL